MLGPFVDLLEIVRSVYRLGVGAESEPGDILADRFGVVGVLGVGVGVIESQQADAVILRGHGVVEADGFGVAYVQEAVRLGREAGLHSAAESADLVVGPHHLAHEVEPPGGLLAF